MSCFSENMWWEPWCISNIDVYIMLSPLWNATKIYIRWNIWLCLHKFSTVSFCVLSFQVAKKSDSSKCMQHIDTISARARRIFYIFCLFLCVLSYHRVLREYWICIIENFAEPFFVWNMRVCSGQSEDLHLIWEMQERYAAERAIAFIAE